MTMTSAPRIMASRKRGSRVRAGERRRSSSEAGKGAAGFSTVCGLASFSGMALAVVSMSLPFQVAFDALFRIADGAGQFNLRQVVGVKTGNIAFVGAGDRFLGLDHFEVVGHAGGKAVLGLSQGLLGQIDVAACDGHLIGCGLQVEQGVAHIGVNLGAKVVEPRTRLAEASLSL